MKRLLTPLLILLTALALALPVGLTFAAAGGVSVDALLPDDANWSKIGPTQGDLYGQSVASAGDVNDDGYADVIIGSPLYAETAGGDKIGAAFIYRGSNTGIDSETYEVKLTSKKGSNFGAAVSSAGDVNGDGYDDVVIGAPKHHDPDGIGANGAAYVFHGSASGIQTTPTWSKIGADNSEFGCAVAGAGDVNGDGYDDVLVGACTYGADPIEGAGAVFLFLGSAGGLSPAAEPFADWTSVGLYAGDSLGHSVAALGDLNKDGYADFAAGAPGFDVNVYDLISVGAVYVWYGSASGPSADPSWSAYGDQYLQQMGYSLSGAGDVDGNTYPDLIVGSRRYSSTRILYSGGAHVFTNSGGMLNAAPSRVYSGPSSNSGFGMSVAGVGDLNDDGYADVSVGTPYCDGLTDNNEGCVFVYLGSVIGVSGEETWLGWGGKADSEYGMSVGGAGDVNGDGYDDLIVGAPIFKWDGQTPLGKVAVYHGAFAEANPYYSLSYLPVVIH